MEQKYLMRKTTWLATKEEALAASSKSHQYLQMNINSLRQIYSAKNEQTTPAFRRIFVPNAARFVCSDSHYTQPLHYPTMDLAIFLLAHIAFLPGEALPTSVEGSTLGYSFYSDCPLCQKYSSRGFQNSGIFLGRTGILVLNLSLFLATTTVFNSLRRFASCIFETMIQTIELAMKCTYNLGNTYSNKSNVCNYEPLDKRWIKFWIDSWTLVFTSKNHTKRSLRGHDASRLRNGRQT